MDWNPFEMFCRHSDVNAHVTTKTEPDATYTIRMLFADSLTVRTLDFKDVDGAVPKELRATQCELKFDK